MATNKKPRKKYCPRIHRNRVKRIEFWSNLVLLAELQKKAIDNTFTLETAIEYLPLIHRLTFSYEIMHEDANLSNIRVACEKVLDNQILPMCHRDEETQMWRTVNNIPSNTPIKIRYIQRGLITTFLTEWAKTVQTITERDKYAAVTLETAIRHNLYCKLLTKSCIWNFINHKGRAEVMEEARMKLSEKEIIRTLLKKGKVFIGQSGDLEYVEPDEIYQIPPVLKEVTSSLPS